jgi:hypothetical protein
VAELVPLLLAGVVILSLVLFVARPPAVFVVAVRGGTTRAGRGKVTDAFLAAVTEVCREFGVSAGEVRGVARGERISLRFSAGFPPAARQRLRNWWAMSGWSARPGARR